MSGSVRLGTQGWSTPHWIGVFYPPGAKQEHYLPFYAQIFDTVEIDTTFYGPPRPTVVRSWERHTPDHFRFAAKVPRAITHESRLIQVASLLDEFVRALLPLGEKLGPVLLQMPAAFERDAHTAADLATTLSQAPAEVRWAVELRHRSWHVPETYDLLRAHRAVLAWTDWRDLPRVTEVTSDFLYVRWVGHRELIERFDRVQIDRDRELESWERDLRPVLPRVREVFGYFNNHWAGHAPASANEMKRRLGLLPVEPEERWAQARLW